MASDIVTSLPAPGFNFENCLRNSFLASKGFPVPKATKTGTTIVGLVYKDGVILGSDTRATSGSIVADKNCKKLHYVQENMYCAGAGTAADTYAVTKMISSQLELHRLATDRVVPVCAGAHLIQQYLFRYQGHVGAALILAGFDKKGPHLYSIAPHGSWDKFPFLTMGSGSLAAMTVFESGYRMDLPLEEAKKLVRDAICAGIFNDLGSGSNVDICIINKDGSKLERPYEEANVKGKRQGTYRYAPGTTAVLSTRVIPIEVEKTIVNVIEENMDVES